VALWGADSFLTGGGGMRVIDTLACRQLDGLTHRVHILESECASLYSGGLHKSISSDGFVSKLSRIPSNLATRTVQQQTILLGVSNIIAPNGQTATTLWAKTPITVEITDDGDNPAKVRFPPCNNPTLADLAQKWWIDGISKW